jgi:hypothetical protein
MSGRTLHQRDGKLITNRKTDRRQSPKRPLIERLYELNDAHARRFPSQWQRGVRMGFLLPKELKPFVADGNHGLGVNVFRGFVQITHGSSEECLISATEFFATIARQRPAFTVMAALVSIAEPRSCGRWLSVVNGAMVESSGIHEPRIYEPRIYQRSPSGPAAGV